MRIWFFKSLAISVILVMSHSSVPGQDNPTSRSDATPNEKNRWAALVDLASSSLRFVENKAFKAGEKLFYDIRYENIHAGKGVLSVQWSERFQKLPLYEITSLAQSNDFFSLFYKVRDTVKTLVDARGIFPWQFEKHLHEGAYHKNDHVIFDQPHRLAYTSDDTFQVPPFVQNVLSAMYFVRTQDFTVGDTLYIDSYDNGKIYPIKIIIHRKDIVRTLAGKFECLIAEPVLQTPALFQQKGRVAVWLTNDHRKIPVLMKSQIYAGNFKLGEIIVELEKMEGVD